MNSINWTPETAIVSSSDSQCPKDVLGSQTLLRVEHLGFDNTVKLGHIVVNKCVADNVAKFFDLALKIKFPIEKVIPAVAYNFDDETMMTDNNSSGFNYRTITGSGKMSPHSLGMAFDINTRLNPYIRYPKNGPPIVRPLGAVRDVKVPGTLYAKHPLVEFMNSLGWEWGGNWSPETGRTDYQHFQNSSYNPRKK